MKVSLTAIYLNVPRIHFCHLLLHNAKSMAAKLIPFG